MAKTKEEEGATPLSSLPDKATGRPVALPGNPGVRATGQQGYFEDHGPGKSSQIAGLNAGGESKDPRDQKDKKGH